MHKRRLYPLLILKVYAEDEFQNALLMIPEIHISIAEFDGPYIAEIVLNCKNAMQCNGKVSPVHKIIQNDRGKFWWYSGKNFLSSFDNFTARILDICVDNEGYNVLQRAAMGGNMVAVQYLIDKGMKNDKQLLRYFERRLRKVVAFGRNDKIPIFQNLFKSGSIRPNYFESLSFFGLFEDQYRYLELLSVRSDIHSLWIDSCVDKVKTNGADLKTIARAFYEELSRDGFLNISKMVQTFQKDLHDNIFI
ncbi:unnamed protein product [Mytilus edulis]|uniref:Uncharacterized protein n=1 Tax=Mytilus edulis TaxID=6550 RepID=A0A8S3R079_MYTED|nr:unnamed protein product [Mytilus edulis]